jgi:hypothetical protein
MKLEPPSVSFILKFQIGFETIRRGSPEGSRSAAEELLQRFRAQTGGQDLRRQGRQFFRLPRVVE